MKKITYLKGDATIPQVSGTKIIAHICNDIGGWGKGFVLAISKRWKEPAKVYREWYYNREVNDFALGNIQLVGVDKDIYIANMIAQRGVKTNLSTGVPPIRYDSVKECLAKLSLEAIKLEASVHMPRIGCGLAGGTWDQIEPLIEQTLLENNIDVYVYDL